MRTLVLVIFTVFVLSLGFMAYWWMQPAGHKVAKQGSGVATGPALSLARQETDRPYGPGKNAWVKKYDVETAKLSSRFKASDYQPRNDGWVVVKKPRAQFFMDDGRALCVEGESGEVIMDDDKKQGMKAFAGSRDTPSRGRLHGVTIYLFHDIKEPETELDESKPLPKAALTVTLNNASFDSQTFKIYSEGYGKGKGRVEADQVPVVLRGEDYDFDGRGLTIRWNERDRRLQLLEVAHGEKLVIKNAGAFMKEEESSVAFEGVKGWGGEGMRGGALPVLLAAKTKGGAAVGEAIKQAATAPAPAPSRRNRSVPKPKITPSEEPPLYRATFHDDVKVVQGADVTVTARKMMVDFLMADQSSDEDEPARGIATTQATTKPTSRAVAGATTAPAGRRGKSARRQARQAATRPAAGDAERVVITWTGKLAIEPLAVGSETPLKDGEAVVRLEGSPVTAVQQGSTITCGALTYRTEDQAMLLTPEAPGKPVVMRDTKGALVHTARMDFYQPKRQAILYGVSDAVFPQEDASGKAAAPMLAKWTKTCTLYFADAGDGGRGDMNIERAELDGNVAVDHPQLRLRSEALELAFDVTKKVDPSNGIATTQAAAAPGARVAAASRPTALEERYAGAVRALKDADAKIAGAEKAFEGVEPSAVLQAKAAALEELETRLASAAKAVKDMEKAGAAAPASFKAEVAESGKAYEAGKAEFEQLQAKLVALQDLTSERDGLAKNAEALKRELAAAGGGGVKVALAATKPAARPMMRSDLRQLVATGAVNCELIDSAQKTQRITCNRLTLLTEKTADGKIYPNMVNADGDVHAVDPEQDLRAGHLAVALRPSTRPSQKQSAEGAEAAGAELQSLIAHKDVRVTSKDGTVATADQLLIDAKDGKNNVKLLGSPSATIVDKKNTLTGPIIEIFPDAQRLTVVGAGRMKGTQEAKAGEAERPIDVSWARGLEFDGKANTVDVTGQVVAEMTDADGATNTARGERVKMLLADVAPTTKPAGVATTQATAQSTTKPSKKAEYAGMSEKTVKQVQFDQDAQITSVLLADNGTLLRRTHLQAATVIYDMLGKRLVVPVEGKMLAEDHRPKAAGQPQAAGGGVAGAESNRGVTAFEWSKDFTYDDAKHVAVMTGDLQRPVVVVHQDASEKKQQFRLTGETVSAELEAAAPDAAKPAAGGAPEQAKVRLRRVTAEGNLLFTGPGATIRARRMEFDPTTNWLSARGTERDPVDFTVASSPGGNKTADEVQYNLETGHVKSANPRVRVPR